jgi:hypothetical protein
MPLTTVRYGRYRTSAEPIVGDLVTGALRACVFDRASQNIWVTKLGAWVGKAGATNGTLKLGLYTASSNVPSARVAYNATGLTVSTLYSAGGAAATTTLATPVKISSGSQYAMALLGSTADLRFSMQQSSALPTGTLNRQFYTRSGISGNPPDPYGSATATVEGHLTAWAEGYANEAPGYAANRVPIDNATIDTLTPTFEADFQDLNGAWGTSNGGADTGDKLSRYWIQVREVGTTLLLWDAIYDASSTERAANKLTSLYGGTALTRGTQYEWRVQVADDFGAQSGYDPTAEWIQFTIANLGYVTLDGSPTGKQDDNSPNTFDGKWTHYSSLSTNAVKIRLLDGNGVLLQESGWITKTVASSAAPGTSFTISWAESTFTDLAWGRAYQYQIKGRDTSSNESAWSAARSFTTDYPPSIPEQLAAAASFTFTTYPKLRWYFTDQDDDTSTGLVSSVRIKNSGGTVLFTRSGTYTGSGNIWEYQTTGTDIASTGTYRWDAYAYDGTLYSGGSTSSIVYSPEASFQYSTGPVISGVNLANGATLTQSNYLLKWSISVNESQKRVIIYAASSTTIVYDSGWLTGSGTTLSQHSIPAGYIKNATSYDLVIKVQDSLAVEGTSSTISFSVAFTQPGPIFPTAQAITIGSNPWASAIQISWLDSKDARFTQYIIRRSAESGPDDESIIIARITDVLTVNFTDYHPVSGVQYTYAVTQVCTQDGSLLESATEYAYGELDLGGIVLAAVGTAGGDIQTALKYTAERSESRMLDEMLYQSLAGGAPETIRSKAKYKVLSFEAKLVDDLLSTSTAKRNELLEIDAEEPIISYRDNHGRKLFCKLVDLTFTDKLPDWWYATISLREESYSEEIE